MKFTSDQLAEYADIPGAVVVDDNHTIVNDKVTPPFVAYSITIEVKVVVIDGENEVCGQFNNDTDASMTNLF